ncbi:MAG: hypothetical protein ABFS14_03065 [Gemmatimonadota bacterium]
MSRLKFVSELKERRFAGFLTAYLAGGWVAIEVIDQFIDRDILPTYIYPAALTLLLAGLPGVVIVTWYHGAKDRQRTTRREVWMLSVVVAIAALTSGYIFREGLRESRAGPVTALDRLDPTEDPRRLAVLYFEPVGSSEETAALAAGITETLIDELSGVGALHVVSANGVAMFRNTSPSPDSVGRALEVGTLVGGSVAQADSITRVTVRVTNASTGEQIGRRNLARPRSELFQLQDDLAREVALFLRETIGQEVELLSGSSGTDNVDAWVLARQADERVEDARRLASLDDLDAAGRQLAQADSLLAQAVGLAPEWPAARTRRGWVSYQRSRLGGFDRVRYAEWIESGLQYAAEALQIADSDPDALELQATLRYWRYLLNLTDEQAEAAELLTAAETDFRASIAANPAQASALSSLSHLLMNRGQTAEAKLVAERSYSADPYLQNANVTILRLFQASLDLEDGLEAQKWCDIGRRRFPEDFRFRECQVWQYALRDQTPDIARAWELCGEVLERSPPGVREFNDPRCRIIIGMALVRAGLADSARAVLESARTGVDVDPIRELAMFEAIPRSWLGDMDEAVSLMATFLAANPGQVEAYASDRTWWFEDLRADPRYNSLLGVR